MQFGLRRYFFVAAKRYFGAESKIGVHSVSNDRDIEDAESKLLTIKRARLWAERGIANAAIGKMVTTRPETITYLDAYNAESSEAGQAQQQSCATQLNAGNSVRRERLPIQ
jgi:hypothetical protein